MFFIFFLFVHFYFSHAFPTNQSVLSFFTTPTLFLSGGFIMIEAGQSVDTCQFDKLPLPRDGEPT
uniref:Secreted protein n=1 Tax=Utricularia reniformis TaxID=192314 RepID=A0A1Y0B234_9LAMI|nr:hypothetical protein AEK19_MT1247 [Utricularia reniformis]ART31457.1 hypothetical protein AEK19_MT1247 [Utricularia reniformis]